MAITLPMLAPLDMGGNQVNNAANGTVSTDLAAYGQTPAGGNTVTIAQGGTGAVSQQAAINALAGPQTAGTYLRSNGTNVTLTALQAADLAIAQIAQRTFCV
jgi:hypothetical protein